MSGAWDFKPAADHGLAPGERLRSVKREPGLVSYLGHRAAGAGLAAWFGAYHRLGVVGRERLPAGPPFVMIANHASHIDALVLAACLPRAVRAETFAIAAGDVFFESLAMSAFSAMFINALPLWRKKVARHALEDLRERLSQGDCGYILFPEGARTRDGKALKYKAGLGMLVAGTPVPVVPCRIDGAFEALPPDCAVPRPRRITVHVGEALRFDSTPNTREGWQAVADSARRAILGDEAECSPAEQPQLPVD